MKKATTALLARVFGLQVIPAEPKRFRLLTLMFPIRWAHMKPEFNFTEYEIYQFINTLAQSRPDFYNYAACKNQGINKFFPGRGKSSLVKKAISICEYCPVQYECFEYAMNTQTEDGVWGGSAPEQRAKWIQSKISVEEAWLNLKQ